ncbi:hypothetical protein LWI28_017161 [Acer negundo]|uniref:Uncharacterized protein n=1 Tax=Acer negundo TaxID=4023 RepID=A0AAD5NZC1_ACENE|nr:hypothetical protein LWI28_017161 [Acer negundo]
MAEPTTGLSPLTEPVCGSSTDKPSIPLIDSSPVLPTPISNNEPMATVDGDDDVLGFIRPLQVYSRREAPAPKPVFVQDSNQASGAEALGLNCKENKSSGNLSAILRIYDHG